MSHRCHLGTLFLLLLALSSWYYPYNASISKGAISTIFKAFGKAWPRPKPRPAASIAAPLPQAIVTINYMHTQKSRNLVHHLVVFKGLRPTLKIFLFPLTRPCFSGMGRSVGKLFFLTSQIPYPLNLIVNTSNIGN